MRVPATADTDELEQAEEIGVCGVEGTIRIAKHALVALITTTCTAATWQFRSVVHEALRRFVALMDVWGCIF